MRIHPSDDKVSYQKTLYNYRKFVFDNVIIDDSVLAIYLDIYYIGEIDYNERSLGTLLIYDYTYPKKEYTLTRNDIKAIEGYIE